VRINDRRILEEGMEGPMDRQRTRVGVALLALAVIGMAAGNVVAAERTVLMEYFNATW
jgi:hypothetical protein